MNQLLTKSIIMIFSLVFSYSCSDNATNSDDNGGDASLVSLHNPVLEVIINEHPYNHNMSITSDGDSYYTINGGGASVGKINKFDIDTTLIATYPIQIDGRGLIYNKSDKSLYASLFTGDIVKITSLDSATYEILFHDFMQTGQASFALSPNGNKLYNFSYGTLIIHDFPSGTPIDTIYGLSYGSGPTGGSETVAVDGDYIYTCDTNSDTVTTLFVYDNSGVYVTEYQLPYGNYGYSLSFVNGFIFIATDGNYSTGTWYGYNIRRALSKKTINPIVQPFSQNWNFDQLDSTN